MTGRTDDLPAGVGMSAYRIVQEALTNLVKHAGPCAARALITRRSEELIIEVTDNGRGGAVAPGASRGRFPGHRPATAAHHGQRADMTIRVVVADDQALVRAGLAGSASAHRRHYQGNGRPSRVNVPVGPPLGRVTAQMTLAAAWAMVRPVGCISSCG